jgi:hypothetical protein
MATAEAMAQISAVMSAPSDPVGVVILRADGSTDEATIDHRKVNELLNGAPTVVGAIRALNVQAVAQRGGKGKANAHKLPESTFQLKIKGDIVLLRTASDAAGSPLALLLSEFHSWVAEGMPDGEESEEEEGEEFEEEEEEEGEEDSEAGSEEDGSGEESDSEEIDWDALPEAEVRQACKMLGIGAGGSKAELCERLIAHAKEETGDMSEEEEEEEEAPAPKPKGGGKQRATAGAAGPSKAGGIAKASKRGRK